jgi:hypothetical protein
MDISNDTGQDAKYKVSGGGTPVGPHGRFVPSEETSRWPVIAAGTTISVPVTSKGPWKVYFVVNGEGFVTVSSADNDLVRLAPSGNTFQVEARRVPHATRRPADHARTA